MRLSIGALTLCLLGSCWWVATEASAQVRDPEGQGRPTSAAPNGNWPIPGTPAQCIGVTTGDTIRVILRNRRAGTHTPSIDRRRPVTVRLYAVTAPSLGQTYGTQARQYTQRLILNRPVMLYIKSTDRAGHILAWVFANSISVNRELVLNGYARWDHTATQETKMRDFENEARLRHRGLWRGTPVTAPQLSSSSAKPDNTTNHR
ncbi:MAG: thermonuclease family protein [Abitibacteriaceae bacterium]|nr:thermonuclease family protein [Abditibacteriaceae bacterium]